jgi:hypothetical protein
MRSAAQPLSTSTISDLGIPNVPVKNVLYCAIADAFMLLSHWLLLVPSVSYDKLTHGNLAVSRWQIPHERGHSVGYCICAPKRYAGSHHRGSALLQSVMALTTPHASAKALKSASLCTAVHTGSSWQMPHTSGHNSLNASVFPAALDGSQNSRGTFTSVQCVNAA